MARASPHPIAGERVGPPPHPAAALGPVECIHAVPVGKDEGAVERDRQADGRGQLDLLVGLREV
eukprot:scaffold496_cov380-Prasinococcus_capsulatus_cf.AAC.6